MIKKFTLLLLAMLCIAVTSKADTTVEVYTGGAQDLSPWQSDLNPEKSLNLGYGAKSKLENAQMTDVVIISYTMKDGESSYMIKLSDPDGWSDLADSEVTTTTYTAGTQTYEYTINHITKLDVIQNRGLIVRGNNVTVTKVELKKVDGRYDAVLVKIGNQGVATWSSSKHLNFNGKGVTPYYASAVDEGTVTLTPITESGKENTTWGYAGYIIKGAEGTYEIPVIAESSASYPSPNYLVGTSEGTARVFRSHYDTYVYSDGDFWWGTDEAKKTENTNRIKSMYRYIFAKHGEEVGFFMLSTTYEEDSKAYHTLAAHKAYLETTKDYSDGDQATSRGLTLNFGDGTTAIWNVKEDKIDTGNVREDGFYYTLQGTRVQSPSKGLYILNGKKVVVK